MFLTKILLLFIGVHTVSGYGYGYGSYGSSEERRECKKLKHYDVTPPTDAQLNRKAKFTHLTKNGKDYVMIECPNDSFMYALISENSGSVFDISGSEYPNTAVLAAGFKVGFVAKCDGKKILAETTDGKKIRLGKVACIRYSTQGGPVTATTPSTTEAASTPISCMSCDMKKIAPVMGDGTRFRYAEGTSGQCRRTQVICERTDNQKCSSVVISVVTPSDTYEVNTIQNTAVSSTYLKCEDDGLYSIFDLTEISQIICVFNNCEDPGTTDG